MMKPESIERMRAMINEGTPTREIAKALGLSIVSIRVACCELGISLLLPPSKTMQERKSVGVSLPSYLIPKFEKEAAKYNVPASRLMGGLLTLIARDDLFTAIMDNDEKAWMLLQRPRRYRRRAKAAPASQVPRGAGNGAAADHDKPHPSNDGHGELVLGKVGGSAPFNTE